MMDWELSVLRPDWDLGFGDRVPWGPVDHSTAEKRQCEGLEDKAGTKAGFWEPNASGFRTGEEVKAEENVSRIQEGF